MVAPAGVDIDTLAGLPEEDLAEYQEHLEALLREERRTNIIAFARAIEVPGAPSPDESKPDVAEEEFYPSKLAPAAHHRLILRTTQLLMEEKLIAPDGHPVDGLIITAPPGSAKSSYASMVVPAFVMGWRPKTNVICASYAQELADRFSRRVRSIIASEEYQAIFPEAKLEEGNTAVRGWSLSNASEYRSTGVGAGIAGFRCNLLIGDDLIANREDGESPVIREKTWNAINDDLLPRAKQDLFKFLFINTRFNEDDHIGRFLGESYKGQSGHWRSKGFNWYILNLPLHAEHSDDPLNRKPGQLLWPQWYRERDAERLRDDKTPQGLRRYASLYQQRPAPTAGAILMREYWNKWPEGKELPECLAIYLNYDTAFEEDEKDDPSAMTAWGVFEHTSKKRTGEEYTHRHIILLGAWEKHVSAVDLLDEVKAHCKLFRPDLVVVEKRASGIQLIQELKRQRIPVKAWLPKGKPGAKGKVPRAHAIAAILEQGSVWYVSGRMTEKVIDQCAMFPNAAHDDLVDTVTSMLAFFRDRHIFMTADDELDLEEMKERLAEKAAMKKQGRRLYGGEGKSGLVVDPIEPDEVERMTEATKRRLYG
jgi:predicted phage terminase large subunit-like protein